MHRCPTSPYRNWTEFAGGNPFLEPFQESYQESSGGREHTHHGGHGPGKPRDAKQQGLSQWQSVQYKRDPVKWKDVPEIIIRWIYVCVCVCVSTLVYTPRVVVGRPGQPLPANGRSSLSRYRKSRSSASNGQCRQRQRIMRWTAGPVVFPGNPEREMSVELSGDDYPTQWG